MTPSHYFSAFRRRWPVLVACLLVPLAAAATLWSGSAVSPAERRPLYSASAILLGSGTRGVGNLETLAALVNVGTVPERVAARLGHDNPIELARLIQASSDTRTGLLTITASGPAPRRTGELANAFAEELLRFAEEERRRELEAQTSVLDETREELEGEIAVFEDRLRTAGKAEETDLRVLLGEKEREIQGIESSREQLENAAALKGGPQLIQRARAVRISGPFSPTGGGSPRRFAVAGALGLALGSALLLLLERFDSRIRTKASAEEGFGLPVLSEIPVVPRRRRRAAATIVTSAPTSLVADAHRLLALTLLSPTRFPGAPHRPRESEEALVTTSSRIGDASATGPPAGGRPLTGVPLRAGRGASTAKITVLVTSPARGDGKTAVAANLAASLSEMGQKVVLLSWDFDRPKVHAVFGISAEATEGALFNGNGEARGHIVRATIEDLTIGVIPSRARGEHPEELRNSERMERLLEEAKDAADVVVIDTAPLLDASDAAPLASRVDSVVVVARAGKTTAAQAEQSTELLRQLSAPVEGVVLNRVKDMTIWAPGRRALRSGR